jgi:prophage maintenance system killer protein
MQNKDELKIGDSQIIIYKNKDNNVALSVRLENENVWLTQANLVELYQSSKSNVSEHIKHIFQEGELDENSTVRKFRTVASNGKTYEMEYYNLDLIISLGYRIKSRIATQFRIWATKRLKEYLVQGYSINQKRLAELNQLIQIIEKSEENPSANQLSETKGLLDILRNYTKSFILLNQYDSHSLELNSLNNNLTYEIEYNEAVEAIAKLKQQLIVVKNATTLFGNQKDQSFSGILKSVTQTFGGNYLYPTIEEQAAHLLYFVIKDHPFSDGNKKIGAFLFVWFLEKNKHLFKSNGENKINDNALAALALLVAQSDPNEKELMIKLICNLIN